MPVLTNNLRHQQHFIKQTGSHEFIFNTPVNILHTAVLSELRILVNPLSMYNSSTYHITH